LGASKTFHPLDVAISSLSLSLSLSGKNRHACNDIPPTILFSAWRGRTTRVEDKCEKGTNPRAFVRKIFLRLDDGTVGDESSIAEMKNTRAA